MIDLCVSVPSSWVETDERSLRIIARVLFDFSGSPSEELLSRIALRLAGLEDVSFLGCGRYRVRSGRRLYEVSLDTLMGLYDRVRYVLTPPSGLPPLSSLYGGELSLESFLSRPFDEWMACDNEYQATLYDDPSQRYEHMRALAISLYRLPRRMAKRLTSVDVFAVFLVFQSLKADLSALYPHLFTTATEEDNTPPNPARLFDSMIRALSGGDITKRAAILSSPLSTALGELDAKAEELELLDRKHRNSQ